MSNQIVVAQQGAVAVPVASLPAMVARASQALALAVGPAEILEAGARAGFAYDAAKAAGRAASVVGLAKDAYDDLITIIYRAQADALEIEAQAKRKFADEYEAAQGRGEFVGRANKGGKKLDDSPDAVLRLRDIGVGEHYANQARFIQRAEQQEPGIVKEVIDEIVERGIEPTKAALTREINTRLGAYSGDNEWYTPARYIDLARSVMGTIDTDPASNDHAQKTVKAATFYTAETDGLDKDWHGKVWMNPPYSNPEVQQFTEKVAAEYLSGRVTEAIILTNNAGDTAWHHALAEASSAMCITRGRIRFESPTRVGNSPAMGQSFFYLGPNVAHFASLFGEIGRITTNYAAEIAQASHGNDNPPPPPQ